MTTELIPIPENAASWCDTLFNLSKPIVMTPEEFDVYWPLVSTVYTKLGGNLSQQNGGVEVQKYECRLRKSKTGSRKSPLKDGVKKRPGTRVRPPGLCQVRIKITRTVVAPVVVTIERLDAEERRHDLARSRELAPSVIDKLKGVGTPEGATHLEIIGRAHLRRSHVYNATRKLPRPSTGS
ncbi:hypothetical protein BZA05DRAFT_418644 [Tricharina praecox]|uniref:uncharacterized protein n=1 Tax=Tricharina praecox TaxID=43433 RepID=UPI00222112F2|nr:uncharacterized protein BZA05DRAFT_418644 [Tricharina praecox]KAI5852368.1 hypothetical protein BZA05DRAFT_418644 [Tricharina praecox]